jgi:hypothetical protein
MTHQRGKQFARFMFQMTKSIYNPRIMQRPYDRLPNFPYIPKGKKIKMNPMKMNNVRIRIIYPRSVVCGNYIDTYIFVCTKKN